MLVKKKIAVQPGRKNFRERIHKRLKSSIWGEKKKRYHLRECFRESLRSNEDDS